MRRGRKADGRRVLSAVLRRGLARSSHARRRALTTVKETKTPTISEAGHRRGAASGGRPRRRRHHLRRRQRSRCARQPGPPTALPRPGPADVARLRGAADALALLLRYHDSALHRRRMPLGQPARDLRRHGADTRAGARIAPLLWRGGELGGARRPHCRVKGYAKAEGGTKRSSPTLGLIVRERLTGMRAGAGGAARRCPAAAGRRTLRAASQADGGKPRRSGRLRRSGGR